MTIVRKVAKVAYALACASALVALGAVLVWATVCDHMMELANGALSPMRCAYTGKVGALIALALAAVSAVALVQKRPGAAAVVAILVLSGMLFLVSFDTPLSIGVCMADGMACHTTAAWMRGCAGVSAVATVVAALVSLNGKRVA